MKANASSSTRHLTLAAQTQASLQQLPRADNLLAMQQRINDRVLQDLFNAHPQIRSARNSSLVSSALVITLLDGQGEIDVAELVRALQHWYPQEIHLAQATQLEIMNSCNSSMRIDIGNADPRLFLARLLHCANKLDPHGASQLVRDFPQADFIDFLYYQVSREIHDDFLEQLPGFESLLATD